MKRDARILVAAFLLCAAVVAACGTVVGNPKKPKTGTPETPTEGILEAQLPLIDFDIDDATFAVADTVSLAADDTAPLSFSLDVSSERSFFKAYGKRVNGIVREVNATAKRINALTSEHGVNFSGRGKKGRLSAVIGDSTSPAFDRQAVLCASGKPFQLFRWKSAGNAVELWRDFRVDQGEGEARLSIVSRVRASKDAQGVTRVDMATLGNWIDSAGDAETDLGGGIGERLFASKATSGEMTLRAVTDRFAGKTPAAFDGVAYVVGRLLPRGKGKKGFEPVYVGFSEARPLLCSGGFDEAATDLWSPAGPGPRFCLGRSVGGKPFPTFDAFKVQIAALKSLDIVRSTDIEAVALPAGLKCESSPEQGK